MEAFCKNEKAVNQLKTFLQTHDSDFDSDEEEIYGNEEIVAQSRSTPTLHSRSVGYNEPLETLPPLMPKKYLSIPQRQNANTKNHIYYNDGQSTSSNIPKLLTKEAPGASRNCLKKLDQYGQQSEDTPVRYPKQTTDGRNLPPSLHNKDHENENQAPNKSPIERPLLPAPKFKSGVSPTPFEFQAVNKVEVDEITTEVNQSSTPKSFEER